MRFVEEDVEIKEWKNYFWGNSTTSWAALPLPQNRRRRHRLTDIDDIDPSTSTTSI
ncbi:MAG: hypothetical protein IJP75_05960 [Bacteroidaceae bacterium]|nr:hypothetical protein [Bacteroidaceae bacterium]